MSEGKKSGSTLVTVLIVVGVALVGAVVVVGLLAALGISGVRRYLSQAKGAEGKSEVYRLAQGIARCAEAGGATGTTSMPSVPPSAPPVPASLAQVSGKKYMSSPSDWAAPAYTCAAFSMSMPQYFQYEWQQTSPTSGRVVGRADLDGDGSPDQEYTTVVSCAGSSCSAAMPTGR
jgi:Tfp pilus assembly protein PilE